MGGDGLLVCGMIWARVGGRKVGRGLASLQEHTVGGAKQSALDAVPYMCLKQSARLLPAVPHAELGLDQGVSVQPPSGGEVPGILVGLIHLAGGIAAVRAMSGDQLVAFAPKEESGSPCAQPPVVLLGLVIVQVVQAQVAEIVEEDADGLPQRRTPAIESRPGSGDEDRVDDRMAAEENAEGALGDHRCLLGG